MYPRSLRPHSTARGSEARPFPKGGTSVTKLALHQVTIRQVMVQHQLNTASSALLTREADFLECFQAL